MTLNRVAWMLVAATGLGASVAHAEGNPKNGLSSTAFRRNTLTVNKESLTTLTSFPLTSNLFTNAADPNSANFATQLHNPAAQAVMTEIVRCALNPTSSVTYTDPVDQTIHTWTGELGICEASSKTSWRKSKPDAQCQELVTACVASRVNALGRAVPISIRGMSSVFTLHASVDQVTELREGIRGTDPAVGQPIASFASGWQPAEVGTCATGTQVTLTLSGASCQTARVCSGIYGCPGAYYSTDITPLSPPCNSITFGCPASLNYSVMVQTSGALPTVTATSGSYPASESDVFNFREGAFFGNMFLPDQVKYECTITATDPTVHCSAINGTLPPVCTSLTCPDQDAGVPFNQVFACYTAGVAYDGDDALGAAYLNDRICDNGSSTASCFPHEPVRCYYADPKVNLASGAHCDWDGAVFSNCRGGGITSPAYPPVTTYLNDRCDVVGDPDLCDPGRLSSFKHVGDDLDTSSDGGCSAGGSGSYATIGVMLAFLLRRRRQR